MNFKLWLLHEEAAQTLDSMLTTTFYKYVKETNPSANLKNPLEKSPELDRKAQFAEMQKRIQDIQNYYASLSDQEKQNFHTWNKNQTEKAKAQQTDEDKKRFLLNYPHLGPEDYEKYKDQAPAAQYAFRKYQRNKWLEKTDKNEWNNLTIVHWFPGNADRKYKEAMRMLNGQIPPHTELSATYYPKDFNMSNVQHNRWGDFGVQLEGEVVSGHWGDAASDDRWHMGKKVLTGEFGTPENPTEKFGGKAYTLKPTFDDFNIGWNELIIRNWKIIALLMYKNNKNGKKDPDELQEDQNIIELAKSKGIPVKIID